MCFRTTWYPCGNYHGFTFAFCSATIVLPSEAHNACTASTMAHNSSRTMHPGSASHAVMQQLGLAHESAADKETVFVNNVRRLGFSLQTDLVKVGLKLPEGSAKQYILPMAALAREILQCFPQKLCFGNDLKSVQSREVVARTLSSFWEGYRYENPSHPVYTDHSGNLQKVIPCRLHADEGTSFRKHGIMQISWGPILKHLPGSPHHCFYFTSVLADVYKGDNVGYERGNATLDSISEHIATNCQELYYQGIVAPDNEKFYFAFIGLEGDLPAQARMRHIVRHFSCSPNACCPWCLADDREAPYSDYRDTATWASTIGMKLPWRRPSPLTKIPGAETAVFACRDIFHLCHLGILRTGVASLLCYLCLQGHFPCSSGTGIPYQQGCTRPTDNFVLSAN